MTTYHEPAGYREIETPFTQAADSWPTVYEALNDPVNKRMLFALAMALAVGLLMVTFRPAGINSTPNLARAAGAGETAEGAEIGRPGGEAEVAFAGQLAPFFAPAVLHWQDRILSWSAEYGVDPNMAATIMQVESCGDPQAVSGAGALGLFQVMPFHFAEGEDPLDPDTNARRGLAYFADRMAQTGGDVGRAFAGYNGGHVAADGNWDSWAAETQRYYVWTTGIYQDVLSGYTESPTLQEWMAAGGAGLCQQAAMRLGL